jgi:hypothetical protein
MMFAQDDYYQEFMLAFGSRSSIDGLASKAERGYDYVVDDIITLPLDQDNAVDIFIPKGTNITVADLKDLLGKLRTVIAQVDQELEDELFAQTSVYFVHHEGKAIMITLRMLCEVDKLSEHGLNQLIYEDVPDLEGSDFSNAAEIFKVDFKSQHVRLSGMEGISFKQDPEDVSSLIVKLNYRGQQIAYKIDGYGNLDLEGRRLYSEKVRDAIHRRTLAVLEHYVTRPVLETSEGTIKANETGTTARIASVVYLERGKNFSQQARGFYLEQRGKDLAVKSELRKLSPRAQGRNSTFRRATEVDDPSLEPLKIYITDPIIV